MAFITYLFYVMKLFALLNRHYASKHFKLIAENPFFEMEKHYN